MTGKFQLKGGVSELNFGYNAKMDVYANSSSDIPKLYETNLSNMILKNLDDILVDI